MKSELKKVTKPTETPILPLITKKPINSIKDEDFILVEPNMVDLTDESMENFLREEEDNRKLSATNDATSLAPAAAIVLGFAILAI